MYKLTQTNSENSRLRSRSWGFSLVEVVVSTAIITIVLLGLATAANGAIVLSRETGKKIEAQFIAEEGLEVARIMRDSSWDNFAALSTSTEYYLVFSGGQWATSTTPNLVDGTFDRTISFHDVYRESHDDISTFGTFDPNTKKATVSVSWLKGSATTSVSMSTYFAKIF
ncbi:prepilin-type N-terminal cleavage/methylation domain-containing protein [Patescibacteria group bacterium]